MRVGALVASRTQMGSLDGDRLYSLNGVVFLKGIQIACDDADAIYKSGRVVFTVTTVLAKRREENKRRRGKVRTSARRKN